DEGEAAWVCPNKSGCEPQLIGKIEHFAGRKMMDIDSIGSETAQMLFKDGLVKNIADLYDLKYEDVVGLNRFADRSAQRLLQGIEQSKKVPFERVVFALSIQYVGETVAKKIARAAGNIDRLMTMTAEELTSIEDIGPRIAESIIAFFADEENRKIVERLRAAGLQMAVEKEEAASDALKGKSIIISGTFDHHSRDEYKQLIERHGGKNVSSISKNTDYVLAGKNMGPAKLEKATSLGITILSEADFLALINEDKEETNSDNGVNGSAEGDSTLFPELF
ncbi:MAG: NAD-dependent DNA ligase LigA, partial [Muribaculaceae bacterium]|nr:NAD-dependent DNA ligase LigA [Muribaculaceae bacterium]